MSFLDPQPSRPFPDALQLSKKTDAVWAHALEETTLSKLVKEAAEKGRRSVDVYCSSLAKELARQGVEFEGLGDDPLNEQREQDHEDTGGDAWFLGVRTSGFMGGVKEVLRKQGYKVKIVEPGPDPGGLMGMALRVRWD